MTFAIVGSLVLVAANGFFVATEFAIARIRPTQIDELEAAGKPGAKSLRHAVVRDSEDEFDPAIAGQLITRHDGVASVKGAAPLHLVAEELGIEISDPHEATIGGHVLELLGRLPEAGEPIDVNGHRAEVTEVGDARILELRFHLETEPRGPDAH